MYFTARTETEIRKYLGFSIDAWKNLYEASFIDRLRNLATIMLQLQEELEDLQWLMHKLQEDTPEKLAKGYLASLENYRKALYSVLDSKQLDENSIDAYLEHIVPVFNNLLVSLVAFQAKIADSVKDAVRIATLLDALKTFWSFLDKTWYKVEETFIESFMQLLAKGQKEIRTEKDTLLKLHKAFNVGVVDKLRDIQAYFRENMEFRKAENTDALVEDVRMYERFANGLLPCSCINNNMHVSVDDCPRLSLPQCFTRVTDNFAYCILHKDKQIKCPGFEFSQGSYVACNQLGVEKVAGAFFQEIKEIDEKLSEQIDFLAKEDPNIRLMKLWSERRDEKIYYATISDKKLFDLLESYQHTTRGGRFNYTIYILENEPVFANNEIMISANKDLLVRLDKGDSMPKVAMTKSAAVMRLTFTSNARLDPAFRDYMRKMKAKKITENTWDVPFAKEDDIERIKAELKEDFGYPISIFQLIESPEIATDGRRYDIYAMTCVAQARVKRDALVYNESTANVEFSDKLQDLYNLLNAQKPLINDLSKRAETIRLAAENLRIAKRFVIAREDEVSIHDDLLSVTGCVGDVRVLLANNKVVELEEEISDGWLVRDINTGASYEVPNGDMSLPSGISACMNGGSDIIIELSTDALVALMQALGLQISPKPEVFPANNDVVEFSPLDNQMVEQPIEESPPLMYNTPTGPGLRILVPELD